MHFMRRFVSIQRSTSNENNPPTENQSLAITHLSKLFTDYKKHPSSGSAKKEHDEMLYSMLPLFGKVFGTLPSNEMVEKFPDVHAFCTHVSRLMVKEIKSRATNQSTEEASKTIAQFLEPLLPADAGEGDSEESHGWMLLSTLLLLASGPSSLLDCMNASSLPATLVKCLYIFFDLPEGAGPGRPLLQNAFKQLLQRICMQSGAGEELAKKDDLGLLFTAVAGWCPPYNMVWRKMAADLLLVLAQNGLTSAVIQHLHNKGCVSKCLRHVTQGGLRPLEAVDLFVTVFHFLRESSDHAQTLLDDFRTAQGYGVLTDFLLKLEREDTEESRDALRNLICLVGRLTMCGFIELKPRPAIADQLFSIRGFQMPKPKGKNDSVRNMLAFQVLQSVFLKCQTTHLSLRILEIIKTIYYQDPANYFILDSQNTVACFADKIYMKAVEVQESFFDILESVVVSLKYVPMKEISSLTILMKTCNSTRTLILCCQCLVRLARSFPVFKDVYRDLGVLELAVGQLHQYAHSIRETEHVAGVDGMTAHVPILPEQAELGSVVMELVCLVLQGSPANGEVFRKSGGARCVLNMLPLSSTRGPALAIVRQLLLAAAKDDDMTALLGLVHATGQIQIKIQVLRCLCSVLRDSHRCRASFRRSQGFLYLVQEVLGMDGALSHEPKPPWDVVLREEVLSLIKTVFATLTVAMKFEPANAKHFATEIRYSNLLDAVRFLGCFGPSTSLSPSKQFSQVNELWRTCSWETGTEGVLRFERLFFSVQEEGVLPRGLADACIVARCLYDMALDAYERPASRGRSSVENSGQDQKRRSACEHRQHDLPTLTHSHSQQDGLSQLGSAYLEAGLGPVCLPVTSSGDPREELAVVHPGALLAVFLLVPAVHCAEERGGEVDLQICLLRVLKSLLKRERNQQVMCEVGLPHELLQSGRAAMSDEAHPLHPHVQRLFERLAVQALSPKDLREFLRLNGPLCCKPIELVTADALDTELLDRPAPVQGGPLPLVRVKCLVSMTTLRESRMGGFETNRSGSNWSVGSPTTSPTFVEFDLSQEGFGCLFLPSIAPQGHSTGSVVSVGLGSSNDSPAVGGIGVGERLFPPAGGFSFSSWVCVDRFCPSRQPHPVRLLTLARCPQSSTDQVVCLDVTLRPLDRTLVVCTQERMLTPDISGGGEEGSSTDCVAKFSLSKMFGEGRWKHLVLVFNRSGMMKHSSCSLYLDGIHLATHKLTYITSTVSLAGVSGSAITSVCAYVGTPPTLRRLSICVWRQGPFHLIEEPLQPTAVACIFQLGASYMGSFQSPLSPDSDELSPPLFPEEKLMFGIYAMNPAVMTVAKIRKVYNQLDAKAIARQLQLPGRESLTPIRILHNSAGHLFGPARSLGAVLIGYQGVRAFCPQPVVRSLECVGGTGVLLGLVAMATDAEGLYAAVKALCCAVKDNPGALREMDLTRGYQTLSMLLKRKRSFLNNQILYLVLSLTGTLDSTTPPAYWVGVEELLCDLELWRESSGHLLKALLDHVHQLLGTAGSIERHAGLASQSPGSGSQNTSGKVASESLELFLRLGLVERLLQLVMRCQLNRACLDTMGILLQDLLLTLTRPDDLRRFGQLMVWTLPEGGTIESNLNMQREVSGLPKQTSADSDTGTSSETAVSNVLRMVTIRNFCFKILIYILTHPEPLNQKACEEVQKVLGYDWLLLFVRSGVHGSSVVMAMHCLLLMVNGPGGVARFRDGVLCSGWLRGSEAVLQRRHGLLLVEESNSQDVSLNELNPDACHLNGFTVLYHCLPHHCRQHELYFLLIALLMGSKVKQLPDNLKFELDSLYNFIFRESNPTSSTTKKSGRAVEFCPEAAYILLAMIRAMLSEPYEEDEEDNNSWQRSYPVTLLQFLVYLYQSNADFQPLAHSVDFLTGLSATLFPRRRDGDAATAETKSLTTSEGSASPTPSTRSDTAITNHPARKFVLDFFKMIITDNFALPPATKTLHIIDVVLESNIEGSTPWHHREFTTSFLQSLMDHLLAAEILTGHTLPLPTGGSYTHVPQNVFYCASRLVDKLWQGAYLGDPKDVVYFVNRLLGQAKKRQLTPDSIYRSLNRVLLYLLSRPLSTSTSQSTLLSTLQRMTASTPSSSVIHVKGGIFSPINGDPELVPCLVYLLVRIMRVTLGATERTISLDDPPTEEGFRSLSGAVNRLWEELYVGKKQVLEDVLKTTLSPLSSSLPPPLTSLMTQVEEPCTKAWTAYQDLELNGNAGSTGWGRVSYGPGSSAGERISQQISARLTGVFRLGGGGTVAGSAVPRGKRDSNWTASAGGGKGLAPVMSYEEATVWIKAHISIVKELIEHYCKQFIRNEQFARRYLESEWQSVAQELTRERGLWGPAQGSPLDKWMLDSTEGPCRMRKKMIRNERFYEHYPYRPTLVEKMWNDRPVRFRYAVSHDSRLHYLSCPPQTLLLEDVPAIGEPAQSEEVTQEPALPMDDAGAEISLRQTASLLRSNTITSISGPDDLEGTMGSQSGEDLTGSQNQEGEVTSMGKEDSESIVSSSSTLVSGQTGQTPAAANTASTTTPSAPDPDSTAEDKLLDSPAAILRLLETGERIAHMFRCARILGLDVCEGLLLFGREHFYVVDGFTLLRTKEIVDIDTLPADTHDPIVPTTGSSGSTTGDKKMYFKFPYDGMREVHKRRYLLQPIALEVFNADGRNFLLVFPKRMQNKIYTKFLQVAPALTDNAQESISGQKLNVKVEAGGAGILSSLIGEKSVTQRWERGEISNFQYLMHLNTLAGRSYNDLMQYPVFPWILADYESEELDLTNPASFRDLSRPMGAQSAKRLEQFEKRFKEWEDPSGETPPYHYGTHYSSAMIVASYLIRMEPFSQHFLKLQGGHFDLADRMFHSIRDSWMSASEHNMADVKELIPEFFYLPDFLVNANRFDLGSKQSGVELGDVMLPPWSRDDPKEFIRAHREALECDYVSAHLHEWIDLIFGYKQRDEPAVEAVNVFHHLFYEGNVDIYSIDDPLRRSAVIGFINNFGQIPKQLFRKSHPSKRLTLPRVPDPCDPPVTAAKRLFYHNLDTLRPSMQPAKELKGPVGQIVPLDAKTVLAVEQNKWLVPPSYSRYLAWGFADGSLRLGQYDSERALRVFEMVDWGEVLCASAPNERTLITAGTSTVVRVWKSSGSGKNKPLQLRAALYGHTEAVTCMAASPAYNLLVTGSRDLSCILWDLSRLCFLRQLPGHPGPVAAVCVNEATGDIASAAGSHLYLWSVNGEEIANVNTATTGRNRQILSLAMSTLMEWDAANVVITGGSDGVVRMWSLEYVQVPKETVKVVPPVDQKRDPVQTKGDSKSMDDDLEVIDPGDEDFEEEENTVMEDDDAIEKTESEKLSKEKESSQGLVPNCCAPEVGEDALCVEPLSPSTLAACDLLTSDYVLLSSEEVQAAKQAVTTLGEVIDTDGTEEVICREAHQNKQGLFSTGSEEEEVCHTCSTDKMSQSKLTLNLPLDVGLKPSLSSPLLRPTSPFRPLNRLREGFRWQRQLLFRGKLTMHTAYERADNRSPACVTALALSRDHRTVYVGDARGRLFAWSVPGEPGRADHWVRDEDAEMCASCPARFTITERRHHCRNCGHLFCAKCSRYEIEIYRLRLFKPVRVCHGCYRALRVEQSSPLPVNNNAAIAPDKTK